jgi:hypothetical protein
LNGKQVRDLGRYKVVEVWEYEWRDKEVVGSTPTHNKKLTLTANVLEFAIQKNKIH